MKIYEAANKFTSEKGDSVVTKEKTIQYREFISLRNYLGYSDLMLYSHIKVKIGLTER